MPVTRALQTVPLGLYPLGKPYPSSAWKTQTCSANCSQPQGDILLAFYQYKYSHTLSQGGL